MPTQKYPAFSYPDFRNLWMGNFVSSLGTKMQTVAILWQIYELTNSPVALGVVGLVRTIPIIIFSLLGGSIADRVNRKHILLVSQTIQALLAMVLASYTFSGSINVYIIYVISALAAVAMSFNIPAEQALIPSLVKKEHLSNAMSLNTIMWQVATIGGPALAGFLLAKFNVGVIYGLNALSFMAVIIALLFMKTPIAIVPRSKQNHIEDIKEGLLFVKNTTMIWSTMLLDFFSTLFASATALLPVFAKNILHVGPQGLGLLYAAPSIGAVAAGLLAAHRGTIHHKGKALLTSIGVYALATIVFGFSQFFLLSFFALVFIGVGDSVSTIIRHTVRQGETPDYIRGRMVAINMIFFMGGPELGEFEAGLAAAGLGAPLSVVTGGLGTLLVVMLAYKYIPKLRNYT